MMRSLWSGVSGLGSHQIAMDVEGNNIANVSTPGFKYSRANFEDMMSQTSKIATGPQGDLGGTNSMQVGLGTSVTSVTKIFKQGSVQTTEKLTDVAIQGDGFFVVSGDGGYTKKFTRNGDFLFDNYGNFVNNSGYIVQGWMRDEETGAIDSTRPVKNIFVKPDLSMPARATSKVDIAATLNTGDNIGEQKVPIYKLDAFRGYFDENLDGATTPGEINKENEGDLFENTKNSDYRLIEKGVDMGILHNEKGEAYNLREGQGIWVSYATAKTKEMAISTIDKTNGADFDVTINGVNIAAKVYSIDDVAKYINNRSQETGVRATIVNGNKLQLSNQNELGTTEKTKNIKITENGGKGLGITTQNVITAYQYEYKTANIGTFSDETKTPPTLPDLYSGTAYDDKSKRSFHSTEDLRYAMQEDARKNVDYTGDGKAIANAGVKVTVNAEGEFKIENPTVANAQNMNLSITGLTDPQNNIGENLKFSAAMKPMRGSLNPGEFPKTTQAHFISAHSTTTQVFDSLGGEKNIKFDFIKEGYADNGGTKWKVIIQVPEPAKINFAETNKNLPSNLLTGEVVFNPDGTLATYYPTSIQYSSNNGSISGQTINLDFGTSGAGDGLVAHDAKSNTKFVSQDGYKGGDLNGIKIDESGTIIGSFTNGHSLGLAKIAMAKFVNNEGLTSEGGTLFTVSPNSGEPIIGEAATAGRGKMQSSALEMSNVDLSRALTQLIVVQRGFQASSKTITTSDQMLNTLLQLKQ